MQTPICDLHFHPSLKPYGHSFSHGADITDAKNLACIWTKQPPDPITELMENVLGIPAYRQADLQSVVSGNASFGVAALYPIETGFLHPTYFKPESKTLVDLVTLIGKERIDYLNSGKYNYFLDLLKEYDFYLKLNDQIPKNGSSKYLLKNNPVSPKATDGNTLPLLLSIEGAHVFCNGVNVTDAKVWDNVEDRVAQVKNWSVPPLFVTFCHHFYNGLASYAQSLFIEIGKNELLDQKFGMSQPVENGKYITTLGYKVIDLLYSTANGKRILIDVKHMAKATRMEFYEYRRQKKLTEIPLLFSHGAINEFYQKEINLDLDDIKEIYASKGLIGVELDQRILGYNDVEKNNRFWNWLKGIFETDKKKDFVWAEFFWKNIITIAEHCFDLTQGHEDPWKIICIGSDLDGIINALNRYRSASTFPALAVSIQKYLDAYWSSATSKIPRNHLGMNSQAVVENIFFNNAFNFIKSNY